MAGIALGLHECLGDEIGVDTYLHEVQAFFNNHKVFVVVGKNG